MVFKKGAAAAIPIMVALLMGTSVAASADETTETESVYTESSYETGSTEVAEEEDSSSNIEGLSEGDIFYVGIDPKSGSPDGSTFVGSSWDIPDTFSLLYYECTLKSDGTISICCKDNSWGEVELGETLTIPANIGGYPVSEVLSSYSGLSFNKIVFESGSELKTIGDNAFGNYSSLETITIPDTVEVIGSYAFYYCENLKTVEFGDGSKLNKICNGAFSDCAALRSISLPKSLEIIEPNVFEGCNALEEITIPENVKELAPFLGYPEGMKLSKINVDENNKNFSSIDGVVFSKDGKTLIMCPVTKKGEYEIPADVTTIGKSAFEYCLELTSVTIPESVTEIGENAFQYCIGLTSVTIPEGVTDIPALAFARCLSLAEVDLPKGLKTLGDGCFSGTAITSIDIPEGVADLPMGAFEDCGSLTEVKLHEGLKTIGAYCFGATALKSIDIPASVTDINPMWCDMVGWQMGKTETKLETINGVAGSYAETFAKDNGITFKSVSSVGGSGSTADTDKDKTDNGTADKSTSDKGTPEKGSPDTGIPEVAAALGVVALAGAFVIISKKRR